MSKRRDLRTRSNAYINNISMDDRKLRNSSFFGSETAKSKYIPSVRHKLSDIQINQSEHKKDTLYNRYFKLYSEIYHFLGSLLIKMTPLNCHSCHLYEAAKSTNLVSNNYLMKNEELKYHL